MNYKGLRKYYTPIPQYVMIHFHMQRFKFIDFMVIELRFFKKKNKKMMMMKTWTKCGNHFSDIMNILHQNITIFCILTIFHIFFTLISLKVK